ncbi:MAG: SRPBCC domain-containing protein [Ilumatobacteraceae bacterium]
MTNKPDSENSVVIERSFNAPADLIWKMWTDPDHFKAWYGPRGATIPVAKLDVRVGGIRLVCMEMTTPRGQMQMWFTGKHLVVAEPIRLNYTESMSDENGNVKSPSEMGMPEGHPTTTEVRVELQEADDRTEMILTHIGIPSDSPGAIGWNMAFDKLAIYVDAQVNE